MLRYALIILVFFAALIYVILKAARGDISGRFRTISLFLASILVIFIGFGLYHNYQHYSVTTIEEKFSENRSDILKRIRTLYEKGQYPEAVAVAQKYLQVQDSELERLYKKSKEAELLQKVQNLKDENPQEVLHIWQQLAKLTNKKKYRELAQEQKEKLKELREQALLEDIDKLPQEALARKRLGYQKLLEIRPDNSLYKQKFDRFSRMMEEKIQNSPWTDICPSGDLPYCLHLGYLAILPKEPAAEKAASSSVGEIFGVSWRPKDTLISRKGEVAPEDGYYYIVWEKNKIVLYNVDYIQVKAPFDN